MIPDSWKPLKLMVEQSKNHWQTIDLNGQNAKKHSMVMVSSKNIEHGNGLSQTSEIINGLFKFIGIFNGFFNLKWTFVYKYRVMFPVLSLEQMILLIIILFPLLQVYVLLRLNLHTLWCIVFSKLWLTIPSQI